MKTFSKLSRVAKAGVLAAVSLVPASVFATGGPFSYNTVAPCRLIDTRGDATVPYGAVDPLRSQTPKPYVVWGNCGVPSTATAVAINFATLREQQAGDLVVIPTPNVFPVDLSLVPSTINFFPLDNIANGAIVPLDGDVPGSVTVRWENSTHDTLHFIDLIADINGYFQ